MAGSIVDFRLQYQLYNFALERALLLTKVRVQERAAVDLRRLNLEQSDQVTVQQERVDRQLRLKDEIQAALTPLAAAQKPLVDLRTELARAKYAASIGDPAGFDNALLNINYLIRSASLNPGDLIGRLLPDSAGKRTRVFPLGEDEVSVATQSLAATYALDLGGGVVAPVDPREETVVLGGVEYGVRDLQYVSGSGDSVTFTVDPGSGPVTYTATVKRGGLGLANSWFYGGIPSDASAASAAQRSRAMADVDAAIKTLNQVELNLGIADASVRTALDRASTALEAENSAMAALVTLQLDEQSALEAAWSRRLDLATAGIALAGQTGLVRIASLFAPEQPPTDTVLDVLLGR